MMSRINWKKMLPRISWQKCCRASIDRNIAAHQSTEMLPRNNWKNDAAHHVQETLPLTSRTIWQARLRRHHTFCALFCKDTIPIGLGSVRFSVTDQAPLCRRVRAPPRTKWLWKPWRKEFILLFFVFETLSVILTCTIYLYIYTFRLFIS